MAITVLAAWFMGSGRAKRRVIAFCCFTAGNVMWVVWGKSHDAYGLIILEIIMAMMNMRGLKKISLKVGAWGNAVKPVTPANMARNAASGLDSLSAIGH